MRIFDEDVFSTYASAAISTGPTRVTDGQLHQGMLRHKKQKEEH